MVVPEDAASAQHSLHSTLQAFRHKWAFHNHLTNSLFFVWLFGIKSKAEELKM